MKKTLLRDMLSSTAIVAMLLFVVFPFVEPGLVSADDNNVGKDIVVKLDVTPEITFTIANQTLSFASIPGLTGGTASAATDLHVTTNNAGGFQVLVKAGGSGEGAMLGSANPGNKIDAATTTGYGVPQTWSALSQDTRFGYAVLDEAGNPNTTDGGVWNGKSDGTYFYNATSSTVQQTMLERHSSAVAASSTLIFQVTLMPGNTPSDTYSATTTLTAHMI